jgi:hypothetical protein
MSLPDYLKKQGLEMQQTEYPPDSQNVNDPPRTPKPPWLWIALAAVALYMVASAK